MHQCTTTRVGIAQIPGCSIQEFDVLGYVHFRLLILINYRLFQTMHSRIHVPVFNWASLPQPPTIPDVICVHVYLLILYL